MIQNGADDPAAVLSTLPAQPGERRLAFTVVLILAAFFIVTAPFAKVQLAKVFAFIPVYQTALVVTDFMTAMLLFSQLRIVRSRALMIMACGYLFTAIMLIVHTLSFPGLFSETGLGAGPQTTAWIYMFWHGGFPVFVIAYALLKNNPHETKQNYSWVSIASGVSAVLATVSGLALIATVGHDLLPPIMIGNHYSPVMIFVVGSVWTLSFIALSVLWRRRPHTMLDLWLMVVMCSWVFDIALSAVLNAGRFDLGFYAGRIYGLLASSFVLIMLLFENSALYFHLAERTSQLQAANKELEAFSYSVSHDLRAPLRAVDGFTSILEKNYGDRLDAEGRRMLTLVRSSAQRMGRLIEDLLALAHFSRQSIKTELVPMEDFVREIINELLSQNTSRTIDFSIGKLGMVKADRALLKQALLNLLGNAIKFTGKTPGAAIEIGYRESPDAESRIFFVKDNGAGFDMKYADKLFGVFQRLHRADEFEGTGIGLSIVQRIIVRHGGRLWAESAPGTGATFYFTLRTG